MKWKRNIRTPVVKTGINRQGEPKGTRKREKRRKREREREREWAGLGDVQDRGGRG